VITFPFIIILFLFASSHSIFFVPCASYACVDQILLLSLECKVRCYILPDTLRFALCCLVKPFSNSFCASLSFFFTFLSAWTCSLLTIRLVSEKRSAYFLFFFFVERGRLCLVSEMLVLLLVLEEGVRPADAAGEEAGVDPEDPEAGVADELHARFHLYLAAVVSRLRSLQACHHGPFVPSLRFCFARSCL